ncbi:MAG TPA: ABC transporter permease subunit, partial [Candidatus Binatia bacterium]
MARDEATVETLNRALAGVRAVSAPRQVVNIGDRVFYLIVKFVAFLVVLLAFMLVADLFRGAAEAIRQFGLKFLVGTTWDPVARQFSTLPTVVGTLVKGLIALLVAVPVSIGSAIFITFYTPRWLRPIISYPIELLAGIPSIIFGMWALFAMVPVVRIIQIWLKAHFGWFFLFDGPAVYGVGVLSGSIILFIMITPIITAISKEILLTVPRTQIEGMLALGSTKWEAIWKVALPFSRIGLFG